MAVRAILLKQHSHRSSARRWFSAGTILPEGVVHQRLETFVGITTGERCFYFQRVEAEVPLNLLQHLQRVEAGVPLSLLQRLQRVEAGVLLSLLWCLQRVEARVPLSLLRRLPPQGFFCHCQCS